MQPKEVVDFGSFLTEWSKCLTVKHQRDQVYRFGTFDDCGRQWQDVVNAAYAKLSNDEMTAQTIMAKTFYQQRTTASTTIGVIWDEKATPGWD
jgi:Protein of unknown function (DUF3128)